MRRGHSGKIVIEPGDWVTFAPKVTQAMIDALNLSKKVIHKLRHKRIIVSDTTERFMEPEVEAEEETTSSVLEAQEGAIPQEKIKCWLLWDFDISESCGIIPEDMLAPVPEPGAKVMYLGVD
jgi:hypothetical protein